MGDDESGARKRKVGRTIHATPDGAQKQFNWFESSDWHRTWILHCDSFGFPLCDKASEKTSRTHYAKSPTTGASNDDLWDQLKDARWGDIVTAVYHTVFARVNGRIEAIGVSASPRKDAETLFLNDMMTAMQQGKDEGGEVPCVVILCGCDTAQFLKPIMRQTDVFVVIGIGIEGGDAGDIDLVATVVQVDCNAAADAVTAALMNGESIDDAVAAGNRAMKSKANPIPVEMVALCADNVDSSLSLRDNELTYKYKKK
jgi:hypothetical protein